MSRAQLIKFLKVIGGTALALLIWIFSSKALQDITVFGAAIWAAWACWRGRPGGAVWKQPAGFAFMILAVYMLLSIPFSTAPALSWRDFTGMLEIFAGAFAIPVIFNSRRRLEAALLCSAHAVTLTLMYDCIRLYRHLGPEIMQKAHAFQPFILNHSNVASMMAGLAALIYFYFAWQNRAHRPIAALFIAGIFFNLAYQCVVASRGPQAALAATIAGVGIIIPGWRGKACWGIALLLAGILISLNIERINPRFKEKETMVNFSQRDKVWGHTWHLIRQRPWQGYGYGKRNFTEIYYSSHPPAADFYYPHPHQYWLKLLFEYGWPGMLLHLAAWLMLFAALLRQTLRQHTFTDRLWPGIILLLLAYIHIYGMGDYPDNIVQIAQIWLIPVALSITARGGQT
ncbi:MAG: O-antigen ligase family protein [Kiritimatiellia bacterium]|nr:O-antigen ligase family protein [Lentisphaerota bacterium]